MRYNFQDILSRFEASSNPRFRALSDAVARRVLELLDAAGAPIDPPEPPTGLTASTDEVGRVSLNWAAVLGASSYNVYRAPGSGGAFTILTTTIASEHIDAGLGDGVSYRYRVTAVNGSGESDPSNTALGSTDVGGGGGDPLPDMVTGLQVTSSIGFVDLAWDAFTGSTVAAALERSSDGGATWSQLATVSTTTVRDEAVTVGGTYHYRAAGVNSAGQVSAFGAPVSTTVQDGDVTPPPVPVLLGTTFRNKAIDLTWEGVVAGDLLGYEVGYGTTPGDYSNVTPLMTGTSGTIVGLTNGTRYYMAVRSVDASTNRNVSAWSNEKDNVAIDDAPPGQTPPAPEAPTITQGWSPYANGVRITFEPAAGATNLVRHRLYMRYTDAPAGQAWLQVDQAQEPIRTLGAGVTIYQGSQSWGEMPVPVEYAVASVDTYNQESPLSVPVVVAHDGSDYEAGAGEGAVGNGDINGLTLSPSHKVHGVMFDAVIDVSDPTAYPGDAMERAAAEWNRRTSSFPTAADHIPLSVDDAIVVAVLLPAQTVNKRLKINRGATSVGGTNPVEAANFEFYGDVANPTQVELHFVGPWTCGGDDFQEAMDRVADQPDTLTTGYGRTFKDESGTALLADNVGTDIEIENITKQGAEGSFYFWNWDIEVTSKYGVLLGSNADSGADIPSAKFDVVFGLTRLHQDAVEPQNERLGDHLVSSRFVRPSFLGCYIDAPWQRKSAVHALSPAQGDFILNTVRFRRAGESAIELMTRRPVDVGLAENDSAGQLTLTAVRHWDENPAHVGGVGRSGQLGAPFFKCGGIEQAVSFVNCEVLEEIATNFTPAWPVSDPYDFRIATALVNMTNPAVAFTDMEGARRNADGFVQGPVSFSGCLFYSRNPRLPVVDIDSAVSVTLTDTAAFTGETRDVVAYADVTGSTTEVVGQTAESYRYGAASPPNPGQGSAAVGPLSATGLNTAQHRADIQAVTGMTADKIRTTNSRPVFGDYTVDHFDCTQDHSFQSLTAPAAPFLQPIALIPSWPTVSSFSALDDMLGMTRRQAKEFIVPGMVASRAPRTLNYGGYNIRNWRVDAGSPQGVYLDTTGNTNLFDVSADKLTITYSDSDNYTVGLQPYVQKLFYAEYANTGDYTRVPLVGTSGTGDAPGEERVVCRRADYERPDGVQVIMDNVRVHDEPFLRYGSGLPHPPLRVLKWGGRHNSMPNLVVRNSDFSEIHDEHGHYGNSEGPILLENNTYRNICAQGTQWVHRTEAEWGDLVWNPQLQMEVQRAPENFEYDPNDPPFRTVRNCHFIDCGSYGTYRGRSASSLTFQDSGYPELPCPQVLIEDCTFVSGLDSDEPAASDGSVAPGTYRYDDTDSPYRYRSSGELRVGIEGGYYRNKLRYSGVDMAPIADARDDDSAALHKVMIVRNCYFHTRDADKSIINLDGIRTIIFEDCVFIHELRTTTNVQRGISIDSDLWKMKEERGTINAYRAGGQKLIFRNCYGAERDYRNGGVSTNGFRLRMYDEDDNRVDERIGNLVGLEREYTLFYHNGVRRTPAQVGTPTYDDVVRPGYMPD